MLPDAFDTLRELHTPSGVSRQFHSLPALEAAGIGNVSRLPISLRIVLESVLRNCDSSKVTTDHVRQVANWSATGPRIDEIPFVVARVLLQDFTGVPLLCDLAAMRGAAQRMGRDPGLIEPLVPVDLVCDHSIQVDHYGSSDALHRNMQLEFARNTERYRFLKWGMQAFATFKVVPPGIGIVHQVNLEYLARGVHEKNGVRHPDSLVGADSHTTMINAIGVVGWGVGGIEAEAGMLGQPVYFLTPDVVGVNLTGKLREGVTATDLVLSLTEVLRKARVVGKFVEFIGEDAASLAVPDRATLCNMAPEYGATIGFFAVDDRTVDYLRKTGRTPSEVELFETYFRAQEMFGTPAAGSIDYSQTLDFDLDSVVPSLAGPKRPQDRVALDAMKETFNTLFSKPVAANGFNQSPDNLGRRYVTEQPGVDLGHGDVLIAAITSCTNTSNPGVLLAAGLLAKKAVAKGLSVKHHIKTSLAPGSRVVTEYLAKAGLLGELEKLNFYLAGYGCTTCIGNAGPLAPALEATVVQHDLVCAAVLSGNRNFEARIHPSIKANFICSPPLVVAYAIAGRVNIDLTSEPIGHGSDGKPVYLRDVWPTSEEIATVMPTATDPDTYRRLYGNLNQDNPLWNDIDAPAARAYAWDASTYIAEPPFFGEFTMQAAAPPPIFAARALCIFGDSVTTDHISPAGSIKANSPAGVYLTAQGIGTADFNSYGSRRGNHEVMMRGTFANVRIRNLMMPATPDGSRVEGGVTLVQPEGDAASIFDAAMNYTRRGVPTVIFAGEEYGTGSSRDWAAKGTQLLGVRAVIAKSFERIHRSNLVFMGVLPCQFKGNDTWRSLGIDGAEEFDIAGLENGIRPQMDVALVIKSRDGSGVPCRYCYASIPRSKPTTTGTAASSRSCFATFLSHRSNPCVQRPSPSRFRPR